MNKPIVFDLAISACPSVCTKVTFSVSEIFPQNLVSKYIFHTVLIFWEPPDHYYIER